jgi:hypothetical protein
LGAPISCVLEAEVANLFAVGVSGRYPRKIKDFGGSKAQKIKNIYETEILESLSLVFCNCEKNYT